MFLTKMLNFFLDTSIILALTQETAKEEWPLLPVLGNSKNCWRDIAEINRCLSIFRLKGFISIMFELYEASSICLHRLF